MRTILEDSGQAESTAAAVSQGSDRQGESIEQIVRAMQGVSSVTERVSGGAAESSAAARRLATQTAAMKDLAEQLNSLVSGGD